jgi:hypothetical protein
MLMVLLFVVATLGLLMPFSRTLAAGLYIDADGEISFLNSPQKRAIRGRLARSEGTEPNASLYLLDVTIPVKSYALVEVDIPFVALEQVDVERGFGDVTIRARARLFERPRRKLYLISSLRTGSGTTRVYPYASQSIDLEAGAAYVDTLGHFDWWASATGAYVTREPGGIPEDQLHGDFGRIGAGIDVTAIRSLRVGAGAMAAFFGEGRYRQLYIVMLQYRRSQWMTLSLSGHAEGAKESERVGDYAIVAGVRVCY